MKFVSRISTQAVGYFQDYEEAQQVQEVYRAFRDTAGAGCPGYETFNAHELLLIGRQQRQGAVTSFAPSNRYQRSLLRAMSTATSRRRRVPPKGNRPHG